MSNRILCANMVTERFLFQFIGHAKIMPITGSHLRIRPKCRTIEQDQEFRGWFEEDENWALSQVVWPDFCSILNEFCQIRHRKTNIWSLFNLPGAYPSTSTDWRSSNPQKRQNGSSFWSISCQKFSQSSLISWRRTKFCTGKDRNSMSDP